jgi:probable HAF family extracellular repeat protein
MNWTVFCLVTMVLNGAFALGQANAHNCVAEHYKVMALPFSPSHISDSGQIAGTTSRRRAALWSESAGLEEVALPTGFSKAEGISVNRAGDLVGVATNADSSKRQAFRYRKGQLSLLPGGQSKPLAINDVGEIVGESVLAATGRSGPVLWRKQSAVDLGACCGGTATGINNRGKVIGDVYDRTGSYQPFLWDKATGMHPIKASGEGTASVAINDAGHVVIESFPHALLYADGKLVSLELSAKYPSHAKAINNCDIVVGAFGPFSDAFRAFLWGKTIGFRDLNTLIADPGWKLEMATSINNRGEIVGYGDHGKDEDAGFLLIPE